jgi:prolipoprotein diacylglyceryltransferase
VQLYELAGLLLVLAILRRTQLVALPGESFWRFVALYSFVQLLVDAFRANFSTWVAGIRMSQMVALVVVLAAMFVLSFYIRQRELNAQSARAAQAANR